MRNDTDCGITRFYGACEAMGADDLNGEIVSVFPNPLGDVLNIQSKSFIQNILLYTFLTITSLFYIALHLSETDALHTS